METIQSDVQSELKPDLIRLDKVGMSDVQISLEIAGLLVPARLSVYVDLKAGNRGIHMSRLYEIILQNINRQNILSLQWIDVLKKLVESQKGLSRSAFLELDYQWPMPRSSLVSGLEGHRNYTIKSLFSFDQMRPFNQMIQQQDFEILYSSTCPQSTSLAKELTRNFFADRSDQELLDWMRLEKNFLATPHAQRSRMKVSLQSSFENILDLKHWINVVELALKTPVQTAVKKSDEMEFARLNAENPLFCEDALRVVSKAINKQMIVDAQLIAYKIVTHHEESLHAHNASGMIQSEKFTQF